MNAPVEIEHLLAADGSIVRRLRDALPGLLGVYAFGSRVEGTALPDSDLDLAVLVAGYADPLQLWDVSADLADIARCDVDLLDLRAANTVVQFEVLTRGRRLWAIDPEAGLFECFAISEKQRWDERIAGHLDDIRREGRVYGG